MEKEKFIIDLSRPPGTGYEWYAIIIDALIDELKKFEDVEVTGDSFWLARIIKNLDNEKEEFYNSLIQKAQDKLKELKGN